MTEQKIYRAGMIGVGRKAHGHARGYAGNPRTEVVAAADPDADNLQIFLDHFDVPGYADYHDMLAQENLDIAAPILPVKPNPQVVIDCARAGVKAIYCEKPMAASLQEADDMVAACAARNIVFAAGDAYRNMPQHWKVKELIDAGELGEVQSINLYQPTTEISGGGCQGLSVMRLFADDAEVDWVTGWCGRDPWDDEDQNMGGYVRFKNGIETFIHSKPTALDGIEVVCTKGVYHSSWSNGRVLQGERGRFTELEGFFDEFGSIDDWIQPSGTRQRGGILSLVAALDQGIEPRCSGANMLRVLEIAIGLRESHRNDFAAVKFPIQDRSLKIVPYESRYLNKKDTYGAEKYSEMIQSSAAKPLGGAQIS